MPFVSHDGYQLHYVTDGTPDHTPLFLVNGLSNQLTTYHDDWVARFVDRGLFVIRLDNRDTGLSSETPHPPDMAAPAYDLVDMAGDVVAVLDDLGVASTHVVGKSMGGMIAQLLAIHHPERVRSVTSAMSTTGEPGFGHASEEALTKLLSGPVTDREAYIADYLASLSIWGSPDHYEVERITQVAGELFDRSFRPHAGGHHTAAVMATPPRHEALRETRIPFLVLHGDRDVLIDVSGGHRTAETVPDARLVVIEGMGHDYPPQLWDRWVEEVSAFVADVESSGAGGAG